jgi:hypothetical protein
MVSLSARRVIVLMASQLILHERYGDDEILRSCDLVIEQISIAS